MKKLNILVIGGTGFLGSNLVNALAQEKHNIKVLSRGHIKLSENYSNVKYIIGDICDEKSLNRAIKDTDFVYHLASTTNPKFGEEDLLFDLSSNLISTINILKKCVNFHVRKFIFCSSGGTVYGDQNNLPISEENICLPISSYGLVKHNIEMYIKYFNKRFSLDYEILRVSNPYGKGQFPDGPQGVIPTFIKKILNGTEIKVFGDGSSTRDYLYIDDFIDLNLKLLTTVKKNNTLNIGSGKSISIVDLIKKIEILTGKTASVNYFPEREFDVKKIHLNINKVSHIYNWNPKVDIDTGLLKTLKWIDDIS